jgi:hypothetical protein
MPQRSDKRIPTWLTIDLLVIVVSAVIIGIGLYFADASEAVFRIPP